MATDYPSGDPRPEKMTFEMGASPLIYGESLSKIEYVNPLQPVIELLKALPHGSKLIIEIGGRT